MADYHRILSYLYRYDKNDKKECRGFVKAEQKRSGLKLTIQIEDDRLMEDMNLDLCFYRNKENHWEMWRMDQLASGDHQEETTLFYPAEQLPEGFDIRQQYGIVFLYRDSFFYGSVWIGDEIPIAALMENYHSGDKMPNDSEEEKQSTVEAEPEVMHREETEEKSESISEESAEPEEEPESISEEVAEMESELKSENISTNSQDLLIKMWIDRENAPKPVDNIFNKAFRQGYKISVDQLSWLSPEAGKLAVNQFLLRGYQRYQHLLAGKVMYAGQERYCVGVPGIYENRERYMAEIYQFPIFLSLTENRIKTGGFGYWLHLLQE